MSHDYHQDDPNDETRPVLFDHCTECLIRSQEPWMAIDHMDRPTFKRAQHRARQLNRGPTPSNIQDAEIALLRTIFAIEQQTKLLPDEEVALAFAGFQADVGLGPETAKALITIIKHLAGISDYTLEKM
jgi:hypothetical protein